MAGKMTKGMVATTLVVILTVMYTSLIIYVTIVHLQFVH